MQQANIRQIKLIIGFGNQHKNYLNTYHNAGFLFIDFLEEKKPELQVNLLKSGEYMNESGKYVLKMIKKMNVRPEELAIVHDDSDLELGKYKLSFDRGAAGHKGVLSTIKALKTKKFLRIRIGIRKKKNTREKASEIVLSQIGLSDKKILATVFREIYQSLTSLDSSRDQIFKARI